MKRRTERSQERLDQRTIDKIKNAYEEQESSITKSRVRQKVHEKLNPKANLPQEKKVTRKTCGAGRLDSSLFNSGHSNVFSSAYVGFAPDRRSRERNTEKPKTLVPWPGEETIIIKDNRKR